MSLKFPGPEGFVVLGEAAAPLDPLAQQENTQKKYFRSKNNSLKLPPQSPQYLQPISFF